MRQQQFLEILDRDEAEARWRQVIDPAPRGVERVPLEETLGRVLAEDVRAEVDVPAFDRSNMDGFAVRAEDTYGASEEEPLHLTLNGETIPTGVAPEIEVKPGTATTIATGGMLPRGADAVAARSRSPIVDPEDPHFVLLRAPGAHARGRRQLRGDRHGAGRDGGSSRGPRLTSRETGRARRNRSRGGRGRAAASRRDPLDRGRDRAARRGDATPGLVFDSNGRILADAVRELGAVSRWFFGAFRDDVRRPPRRARPRAQRGRGRRSCLSGRNIEGRG